MVELLLAVMFCLVVKNETEHSRWNTIGLGICSGLFIFNRPSDSVLILPFMLYILVYYRAQVQYYLVSGIIAGAPFLLYNLFLFHNPLGGYAQVAPRLVLGIPTLSNYLGLLIAPNKGLLVFSPVLILSVFGFWSILTRREKPVYRVLYWSVFAVLLTILVYALFDDWIGGLMYGPRYLTGILPFLAIGVCIFLDNVGKNPVSNLIVFAIAALIIVSVLVQIIGAFYYPPLAGDETVPQKIYDPWSTDSSIIVYSLFHGNLKDSLPEMSLNETQKLLANNTRDPGKRLLQVHT
jgi:hypothetical protein